MVTRLYFTASSSNPASTNPAFDAGWVTTAVAVRRSLIGSKAAATETLSGTLGGAAADNSLAVQAISPPLSGAQSIGGAATSWSGVGDGRELDLADNIDQKVRAIKVISNDGTTVRGTLVSLAAAGNTTEALTSLAGWLFANAGGLTQVSAQDTDRILVEWGPGEVGVGTTPNWELRIGGNGTDHALAQGDTTGSVPWIEFSQNLTFGPEVLVINNATHSSTATTVGLIPNLIVDAAVHGETSTVVVLSPVLIVNASVHAVTSTNVVLALAILFFTPPHRNRFTKPQVIDHWHRDVSPPLYRKQRGIPAPINLFLGEDGLLHEEQPHGSYGVNGVSFLGGHMYGPLTGAEAALLNASGFGAYLHDVPTPPEP